MRRRSKLLSALLIFCMLLCLTSCGKAEEKQELGEIHPADVTEDLGREIDEGPFHRLESKFYDDWQTINSGLSGMSFSVPASWEVTPVNARHYRINAPISDPAVPGATFNVIYVYNYYLKATRYVEEFDEAFADDISGLLYQIDGEYYSEIYQDPVVTQKYSEDSFGDGSLISCNIIEDVHLQDKLGYQPKGQYNAYHYSIKWNDVAMQIRTVVTPDYEENAKRVFSEIASTITPYQYPVNSTIDAEFSTSRVMLPEEFKKDSQNGVTIYKASEMEDTPFAGIRVAELTVECDTANFDKAKFSQEEIMDAVDFFFPGNLYLSTCENTIDDPYQMTIRGEDVTFVYANIMYNAREDRGGSFFGNRNNTLLVMYILPSSTNEHKAICTMMLEMQEGAMSTILDCMNKSIIMK